MERGRETEGREGFWVVARGQVDASRRSRPELPKTGDTVNVPYWLVYEIEGDGQEVRQHAKLFIQAKVKKKGKEKKRKRGKERERKKEGKEAWNRREETKS